MIIMKLLKHIWKTLRNTWYNFLYSIQLYISMWRELNSNYEKWHREIERKMSRLTESINEDC